MFGLHGDLKKRQNNIRSINFAKKTDLLSGIDQLLESHYSIHRIKKAGSKEQVVCTFLPSFRFPFIRLVQLQELASRHLKHSSS